MVLEFNGEARRIVLSHTRTFEEGMTWWKLHPPSGAANPLRYHGHAPSIRSVNEKVEKSTLGDLGVLSGLKERHGKQGARFERQEERRGRGR
jgi:small subunit ribosomal protein S1